MKKIVTLLTILLSTAGCVTNILPPLPPSSKKLKEIEAAAGNLTAVKPQKPRKLLVITRCGGYRHSAIPYASHALDFMGRRTGAWETVISRDLNMFDPENLNQFDAVCLNNTVRLPLNDPARRQSLLDFVASGKGLIGIHGAADNFHDWPEGARLIGALFDWHPWNETVAVKLDDPDHSVCKVFQGRGFEITDEIYQFKAPYSRENLHVLLSLDTTGTNMKKWTIKRDDNDFAISWIQNWGRGRVFYCSLGHRHDIFQNPIILQFYLDGIQYALGDQSAK